MWASEHPVFGFQNVPFQGLYSAAKIKKHGVLIEELDHVKRTGLWKCISSSSSFIFFLSFALQESGKFQYNFLNILTFSSLLKQLQAKWGWHRKALRRGFRLRHSVNQTLWLYSQCRWSCSPEQAVLRRRSWYFSYWLCNGQTTQGSQWPWSALGWEPGFSVWTICHLRAGQARPGQATSELVLPHHCHPSQRLALLQKTM